MAAFASAAAQLTAEGSLLTVATAMAVLIDALESDSVIQSSIVLLPNGLFQGVVIDAQLP